MKRLTLFVVCVMASLALTAQNTRLVKGLVFSEEDIPMQGVTLSVVGMNGTTQSTENGLFELYVSPYAKKLKASMDGYIPHVLEIDGSYLVFKLKVDKEYAKRRAAEEEAAEKAAAEKAAEEEKARKAAEREAIAQAKTVERYTATRASEKSVPTKPTNTNGVKSEDSVTVSEKPDTYKVGDYYNRDGKDGVVVSVSSGGIHGKIVRVYPARLCWEDANQWCSLLGDGWRLPTISELKEICSSNNRKQIGKTLSSLGITIDWNSTNCWCADEYGSEFAYAVFMKNGSSEIYDKGFEFEVFAVCDFKTTNSR